MLNRAGQVVGGVPGPGEAGGEAQGGALQADVVGGWCLGGLGRKVMDVGDLGRTLGCPYDCCPVGHISSVLVKLGPITAP